MFSEKLKKVMQELGLNQAQVVKLTGCSKGAISMYINNKVVPDERKKRGIAVSLGLAPDYFEYEDAKVNDVVKPVSGSAIRRISTRELSKILGGVDRATAAKAAISKDFPGLYAVQTTNSHHVYFINDAIFCKI